MVYVSGTAGGVVPRSVVRCILFEIREGREDIRYFLYAVVNIRPRTNRRTVLEVEVSAG